MVTYIYFVKCPNCEDEHFDFFDDAKGFAMGCLSKKPIITQTEVCRNDFGECTDSSDLGTVWSWEDECKDCQEPVEEPVTFTKDEIVADYKPDTDPEFVDDDSDFRFVNDMTESLNGADLDEIKKLCDEIGIITMYDLHSFMKETGATDDTLVAKLREYRAELGPDFKIKESRKPVPEGMTIEQLVETMEENEDEVECTWCNDVFPKDMCKKEVNLGYLCPRCADGIMSRGETLTFKENNYWDFLDEKFGIDFEDEAASDFLDATSDAMSDEDYFNQDFEEGVRIPEEGIANCVDSGNTEIWGIEQVDSNTYNAVLVKRYENVSYNDADALQNVHTEMFKNNDLFTFIFTKDGHPELYSWNAGMLNRLVGCEINFEDSRYDDALNRAFN